MTLECEKKAIQNKNKNPEGTDKENYVPIYKAFKNINESVNQPRFYHLWLPDKIYLEKGAFDSQTVDSLKSLGYVINKKFSSIGRVDAIYIDKTNKIFTAADPRGDDYSLGE